MARLNSPTLKVRNNVAEKERIANKEGATAYSLNARKALIESVLGAFWNEESFYKTGKESSNAVVNAVKEVAKIEPKFVLQTAAYARNAMYMRTTPQVILVEAANIEACKPFVREYTPKIVKRADELADVIAYQLSRFGKPIPNSLKRGLAQAFSNFDEYQLNKYDSDKNAVKLGDVLRLIERRENWPVSKAMYNYLVNDIVDADALPKIGALKQLLAKDRLDEEALELIKRSNVTWETLISKFGSTKETWELVAPNMGYMAKLRNLRNFAEKGVDLDPILAEIADPNQVKRSKQLPFRFYSAFKQINEQNIQRAIAKAFDASISNVSLDGNTAVLVDMSGSMHSPLSAKSSVQYVEVGAVLGAIATKKAANSTMVRFASTVDRVSLNPDDTMMTNVQKILHDSHRLGGGTEAHAAFTNIMNERYDRVILISDMQCYNSGDSHSYGYYFGGAQVNDVWETYVKKYPSAKLYSLDVHSYGTSQTPSNARNVTLLFGWSDKIFDLINIDEKRDVLEQEIRNY